MASLTIKGIDPDLEERLRIRAARYGRSMEDEARDILRCALSTRPELGDSLVGFIRARVEADGGVEIELPVRDPMRVPPGFE